MAVFAKGADPDVLEAVVGRLKGCSASIEDTGAILEALGRSRLELDPGAAVTGGGTEIEMPPDGPGGILTRLVPATA